MTTLGGWAIHLQVMQRVAEAAYDDPAGGYDADDRYDSDGLGTWTTIDCQLLRVTASLGAPYRPAPSVVAEAGRLSADLMDPDRILDPTLSPFAPMMEPGAPVRLIAQKPDVPLSAYTTQTPTDAAATGTAKALGADFTFASAGRITALRFRRGSSAGVTSRTLRVWNDAGVLLAGATTIAEVAGAWNAATLSPPLDVVAGQTVRVSYDNPPGATYARISPGAATVVNGPVSRGARWYSIPSGSYPTTSTTTDYMADVIFEKPVGLRVMWTGAVDSWSHDLLTGQGQLDATDRVGQFAATPVVEEVRPSETTVARLEALVALMPDPPPLATSGAFGSTLAAAGMSGDMWSLLAAVVDSDASWLWINRNGVLRWVARGEPPDEPLVFLDCPDAEPHDAVYTGLTAVTDEQMIVNQVVANRVYPPGVEEPPSVYAHGPSARRWDPHEYTNTELQLSTEDEVRAWANNLLAMRAYPTPTVREMTVTVADALPWANETMTTLVVLLDLASPVRVVLTSRGPRQHWDTFVCGLEHQVTPHEWVTRVQLAPRLAGAEAGYDADRSIYDLMTSTYDETAMVGV